MLNGKFMAVRIAVFIIFAFMEAYPGIAGFTPELMNANLRLAAMGDISIVIEDFTNEINIYDFGGLGAGVIDDNGGKTNFFIPTVFCSDMTEKPHDHIESLNVGLMARAIVRVGKNSVVGGVGGILKDKLEYHGWWSFKVGKRNIYDTLIFAHNFNGLVAGIRAGYIIKKTHITDFYGPRTYLNEIIYSEPSLMLIPKNNPWKFGLAYEYVAGTKYLFHTIKIPVIYNISDWNIGSRCDYQFVRVRDAFTDQGRLLKIQLRHKIKEYLLAGFSLEYDNRYDYDLFWRGMEKYKRFEIGFGISYLNLFGIEYRHKIDKSWEKTGHFNQISAGWEINQDKEIPLRFGYSFGFSSPLAYHFHEMKSIISAGFGLYPVNTKLKIDFASRLGFYKYNGWWYTRPEFGISCRI